MFTAQLPDSIAFLTVIVILFGAFLSTGLR